MNEGIDNQKIISSVQGYNLPYSANTVRKAYAYRNYIFFVQTVVLPRREKPTNPLTFKVFPSSVILQEYVLPFFES